MTFFAIMLIIAGVVLAVVPDLVFNITQSWKHGNSSEPSDSYRYITRVQGIILVIVGIVLIIKQIILPVYFTSVPPPDGSKNPSVLLPFDYH